MMWKIVAIGVVVLLVLSVVGYFVMPGQSPRDAGRQYIEDNYDAIAEDVVKTAFQNDGLKEELIAEVAESIAEQVVPYDCSNVVQQGAVECNMTFKANKPVPITVRTDLDVFVVKSGRDWVGRDWRFTNVDVNGLSALEKVADVADSTSEVVQEVEDVIQDLNPFGK